MEEKYFVHPSSFVDDDVEIGEGTKIWHFCHIQKGARIGKHCSLGQNVNVSNHVKVGDGCVIGAGSVVTRDIPAHSFAAGVPCRVIRPITAQDSMALKPEILGGYSPIPEED